jgi:peptidoglycan/xylan/chitin deacetylase (PgdA/CDA1 family)
MKSGNTAAFSFFLAVTLVLSVPLWALAAHKPTHASSTATSTPPANAESSTTPEVERKSIKWDGMEALFPDAAAPERMEASSLRVAESSAAAVSENLIPNPSLETAGSGGLPASWKKGGYGTNTRTLTYPVTGASGNGIKVQISNFQTGDGKWYFNDVPVQAGKKYRFSDSYQATAPSVVTVQFKLADGSYSYLPIAFPAAAASFTQTTAEFVVPPNAVALTIFHALKSNGTLTTDNYDLREIVPDTNYVSNGTLEAGGTAPNSWGQGRWGQNTTTFSYPVTGVDGSKAARVTLANRTSGDAKWYFNAVALPPGTYTYQDTYMATVPTYVTVQIQHQNGSVTYEDIAHPPSSTAWRSTSGTFTVPETAALVTVFHLINQNGTLTIDNVSVTQGETRPSVFDTGAVTLRFDDNWDSQYTVAFPKLNSRGLKGVLYVVSRQIEDTGFPGYMTRAQIEAVYDQGHEIGAHTRTHRDLATLSTAEQTNEIAGSRQDLQAWDVGEVTSFAYPFGSYTAETIGIVRDAGFESAASSNGGYVTPTSDPYQLERFGLENTTTFAQAKQWIDDAVANKQWLILSIHDIRTSCTERYCVSTAVYNQIVDYLADNDIPVVTVEEAFESF